MDSPSRPGADTASPHHGGPDRIEEGGPAPGSGSTPYRVETASALHGERPRTADEEPGLRASRVATTGSGGSTTRRIVRAALPLSLSLIVTAVAALINTAVLGRHDTAALAAFTVAMAVYLPATAAVSGATRGVMPFVAARGTDQGGLATVVRDGLLSALLVGLFGAAATAAVGGLARAGGVPDATIARLGPLPLILAVAVLVTAVGSSASAALVGLGRTRPVLYGGLAGALITVTLSPALVFGFAGLPGLGAVGAGAAVLIAVIGNALVTMVGLRGAVTTVGSRATGTGPALRGVVTLLRVGIPLSATVLIKFASLGVLAFAAARIGTAASAAHGIAVSLVNLAFTMAVAVGQATVPLIARDAAAGGARSRPIAWAGVRVGVLALTVVASALAACRDLLIPLFSADVVVTAMVAGLLPWILLVVAADGMQAMLGFALIGLRRTVPSMIVLAAGHGLLVLLCLPIAASAGLTGLWAALLVTNLLLCVGQVVAFRRVTARPAPPTTIA
ncbi:MATE family multidrug resistance protein [Actinoalloteichus hoggarensis]|uniref:Probable multidrug resistance protein NorM n=1 Tax=Actinoalloteichus hoggarensis TaxID=1470176 RepID=A0A221W403_9PSEU|nr:MATE family efflux transporter [Actinoalloteichus hoggarensis]ASO20389.1 Multidrug resistance protein NorM [Actinoalloteichus hoggarensis]MBB5923427.1 MATE family multidrug resistance protein [Actinoalloteichus hoggarensis]